MSRHPGSYPLTIIQWFVVIFVFLLLAFVVEAIRRGRLKERYALLWLGAAGVMFLLAAWRSLLDRIAVFLGVLYGPSLLFLVALLFLFAILLHFSLVISEHRDKTRRLTQHLALLAYEVERLREEIIRSAPPT
jgi:hypothetical protein